MRRLLYSCSTLISQYRKLYRTYALIGVLLVSAVVLMACGAAATPAPTVPPTQTPTTQPSSPPTPTPTEQRTPTPRTVEEPAPVESVAIEVTSTDPVAADLVLVTGLPNGCYSFNGYEMEREGDTFQVMVTNIRPDDDTLMCTMIYGMHTTRISLSGEIKVCEFYPVVVNGEHFSVQAIAPNVRCADTTGNRGMEVTLKAGEAISAGNEGLQLAFVEVTEDSRCPSDVLCIQAGQATIKVKAEMDGRDLGTVSLTLGPGESSAPETLGGYTLELTRLDPYPVTTMTIQPEDYVAYVTVTKG